MDLVGAKVAVIGGAGFIGLHVVRELLKRRADPKIIDMFRHGQTSRDAADKICSSLETDVTWDCPVRGFDLVINLATRNLRDALVTPMEMATEIHKIGCNVAYECAASGVRRYVYVSSSEIYGDAIDGRLNEASLPRPKTTYGAAKLAGEHYARCARLISDLETVVIRPFNAYGPGCHLEGNSAELIPRVIQAIMRHQVIRIFGTGTQTRDFIHVRDLARGIVVAAACDDLVGTGPVNLASGTERSVNEIVDDLKKVGNITKVLTHRRPADLQHQIGDASRAATILRWSPEISWDVGLDETINDVLSRMS